MSNCRYCGEELQFDAEKAHGICYACAEYFMDDDEDDDFYDDDDYDDYEERKIEELLDRCSECTCGAWQVIDGKPTHVADCCCGAE